MVLRLCDHLLSIFVPSGFCKPGGVDLHLPTHGRDFVLFVGNMHQKVGLTLTSVCSSSDGFFEEALYRFNGNGNTLHSPG